MLDLAIYYGSIYLRDCRTGKTIAPLNVLHTVSFQAFLCRATHFPIEQSDVRKGRDLDMSSLENDTLVRDPILQVFPATSWANSMLSPCEANDWIFKVLKHVNA